VLATVPNLAVAAVCGGIVHARHRLANTPCAAAIPTHEAEVAFTLTELAVAMACAVVQALANRHDGAVGTSVTVITTANAFVTKIAPAVSAAISRARLLATRQTLVALLALAETTHARATRRLRFVGLAIFCALANRAITASPINLALALANGNITKTLLRTLTVIFAATKSAISTEISNLANAGTIFALAMCKAR